MLSRKGFARFALACALWMPYPFSAQEPPGPANPAIASGTLNLILANKNGFVIAADSRMSGEKPFSCKSAMQLYCDNSQKLFRTGQKSAMVIAGFAAGRVNSPLDLTVASALRKRFGAEGLPGEMGTVDGASDWAEHALGQSLTGVAALYDAQKTLAATLALSALFAGVDNNGVVVLRRLSFEESWKPTGPASVQAPDYDVRSWSFAGVEKFGFATAGITCVADAILGGYYKTEDHTIQDYYKRRREAALDNLTIEELKKLAKAILRETRNFTPLVGGEDQIGTFPVSGAIQWLLPALPSDSELPSRFLLWKGLNCMGGDPPCSGASGSMSFFEDFQRELDEPLTEFFLASQFEKIHVALDNNYFVDSKFDGAILQWRGGPFFMRKNSFNDCVVELPENLNVPSDSELHGKCRLVRKSAVAVETTTVGSPKKYKVAGCRKKNPDGSMTFTAGGGCGPDAGLVGPPIQP